MAAVSLDGLSELIDSYNQILTLLLGGNVQCASLLKCVMSSSPKQRSGKTMCSGNPSSFCYDKKW